MTFDQLLLLGSTVAALVWAALSIHVLRVSRRRADARLKVQTILTTLRNDAVRAAGPTERVNEVKALLDTLSRDMVLHTAADPETPAEAFEALSTYLVAKWPVETLLTEASAHRRARDVWRRTAALRIAFRSGHPKAMGLLEAAVKEDDADLANVALGLLGTSPDLGAVDIMIDALRARRHSPARIATHLEGSPVRPMDKYRELLADGDPVMRLWGAKLLGDYPDAPSVELDLAPLVEDADPGVRKAAIESLGRVGNGLAARAALRLLTDPVAFVRAYAARALGELDRADAAEAVAALLGDPDWWVRHAAKQSLERMGADIWPVLVRCLDDSDRFVRNGAAEVFQNIGVLDSFIVMEAASDDPSHAKVELLRRVAAAGGTRLTESLVERAGPKTGPRVRRLLETVGLEHVGAA